MKRIISLVVLLALVGCSSTEKKPSAKQQVAGLQTMCKENGPAIKKRQAEKSLYERLGKRKKITVFVNNLYRAHKNNKEIGHMFKHVQKNKFTRNVVDFLTVGTGGKGKYKGRNMKNAHAHLNISSADFLAAGGDVNSVMKDLNYGDNEIQEVVCALVAFVPVVVKD